MEKFQEINKGYNSVFQANRLSLGLVVPIESYQNSPVPTMNNHLERVQLAEKLGFSAVWLRDVPFNVPSFGDAGQTFDPFVYLGLLAGQTKDIALGVASIILPLRHPAHVAKAAATVDVLSGGRLILGVASGDRPQEYPALELDFSNRGERFRDAFDYIRQMANYAPEFTNPYGSPYGGMDMLPKPVNSKLPLIVTGGSQQNIKWIAQNSDGWMLYPRPTFQQAQIIRDWKEELEKLERTDQPVIQPVMQPLYIDLTQDPDSPPKAIHLGMRLGVNRLVEYLKTLEGIGINHVALNLRFNNANTEESLYRLSETVLKEFNK